MPSLRDREHSHPRGWLLRFGLALGARLLESASAREHPLRRPLAR
jgi:hypothetical protein